VLQSQIVLKSSGVGKVMETDKLKFGKKKHHWGLWYKRQWIFGKVEEGDINHMVIPNRTKEIYMYLIHKYIEQNTTIIFNY
jgi:hypothetical protein